VELGESNKSQLSAFANSSRMQFIIQFVPSIIYRIGYHLLVETGLPEQPSVSHSDRRARDKEPLVVDTINWSGFELLMSLDVTRVGCLAIGRVVDGDVGACTYQPSSVPLRKKTYRAMSPR